MNKEQEARYKNMTKEDIEQLSGLEREVAQLVSGIWLSRRITIQLGPEPQAEAPDTTVQNTPQPNQDR
ncbi:MAG: hypothetical protein GWP50_03045 [Proteobacteria bacterium]|nr:hypothetical protein [Pseudomonadota bacterium]